MITSINLTQRSLELLHRRDVNDSEIAEFQQLLNHAQTEMADTGKSSKQFLQSMDADELSLLRKVNSLAENIYVSGLSEEGATNLIKQPDHSDRVDLNNDGIVEVGLSRSLVFPPVNAPDFVKQAWDEATKGMKETDVMMLQLHMHIAVFGVQIEGQAAKTPQAPEQQWSTEGIQKLFSGLYGALEFAVNLDGWTDNHKMKKAFYERFNQALASNSSSAGKYVNAQQTEQMTESKNSPTTSEEQTNIDNLMQLILDARIGLDRKKLEEIEEKIKAIEHNSSIDPDTKKAMLEQLESQKQDVLDKAQERIEQEEKIRALKQQF
ncbi:hypothetical protein L0668_10430 [Paraglaciecola aquimarina]|uniref:Uncharacterized protein n=1 Tax=Paraglaciecola algarum TaxID=3050085 RepID=A0ABS9D6F6_9ALTE|nr:hypothetical protein [Paraglaciecola sp. G1-23]MCF2948523.1 hypothetical protein [Paraglaciecola sp. G1-23]